MKITLHEVAAHAGVSIATASRALSGLAVSPHSQERVRAAVVELGYVANEAARMLRSERSSTIGLIFLDLRSALGIGLIDALGESIEAGGYALLIASARGDAERYEMLMRRFLERRIDALFCVHPRGNGEILGQYRAAGVPIVTIFDQAPGFADLPLLTKSLAEPSAALAAQLHDLGHRRIALVGDEAHSAPLTEIGAALVEAALHVSRIEPSEAGGMTDAIHRLMTKTPRPTAVIAIDPLARGLLAACKAREIAVPRDLSIISIAEIGADAGNRKRGISAIVVDPQRMARAAGGAMLAWLAGARPADRISVQTAVWVPRATFGAAPVP